MSEQYATPLGNTVGDFEDFHDGAIDGNYTTLKVTLSAATYKVEELAPRPDEDPWPDEYVDRGKNAELLVARWMWDTDMGQTSSEAVSGINVSYNTNNPINDIVKATMGIYAKDYEGEANIAWFGTLSQLNGEST